MGSGYKTSDAVMQAASDRLDLGIPSAVISAELGVGRSVIERFRAKRVREGWVPPRTKPLIAAPTPNTPPEPAAPALHEAIRKALKAGPLNTNDLANTLDMSPARIGLALKEMQSRGFAFTEVLGSFHLTGSEHIEPSTSIVTSSKKGGSLTRTFGVLGDTHLCNKHARLDVLRAAYAKYEERGITDVYHTGNIADGEARFNKTELITAPGFERQVDYTIQEYPAIKGITTHFVVGDDHEGWYMRDAGVDFGKALIRAAEDVGRTDLDYIGYGECDVRLQHGSGEAVMRVLHPGGGSSYAVSYTSQKRVESYQGGDKPQIELAGHYHKFNVGYPREVHCVDTGCCIDQTMFLRKKKIQCMVGYLIVNITQNELGVVEAFNAEWFPFYDRKYYERRFEI